MILERAMVALLSRILLALRSLLEVSASREAEILILRQQLLVLSRRSPKRIRLRNIDRFDFGLAVPPLPVDVGRHGHSQAGNRAFLASTRLSRLLALEVLAARWTPTDRSRAPRVDPSDEQGKSALGRAADPRRIADARD